MQCAAVSATSRAIIVAVHLKSKLVTCPDEFTVMHPYSAISGRLLSAIVPETIADPLDSVFSSSLSSCAPAHPPRTNDAMMIGKIPRLDIGRRESRRRASPPPSKMPYFSVERAH